MRSQTDWIESLSPWPQDGFGLDRMRALLTELGDPQLAFPAVHVVGTNGKGTTTRTIEETLTREGLLAGGYYSPHVTGWSERIRIGGAEADFERAIGGVRPQAMAVGATQFEALTAAALLAFAEAGVDVAAVEAGLGGRHDATNVLQTRVVVLTNVGLDHTEVLGSTREAIAREKLAVVQPESIAVLGEAEWEAIARRNGAARVVVEVRGNSSLGGAAASAFLGRGVRPAEVKLPGRLEFRPDEIRDGAHTPEAVRFIAPQLPPIGAALASILSDKDVDGILRELRGLTPVIVATRSSHPRALPADTLANRARPYFETVESADDPVEGLGRAHALGSPVLVTGSLYLLADLLRREEEPRRCRNLVNG